LRPSSRQQKPPPQQSGSTAHDHEDRREQVQHGRHHRGRRPNRPDGRLRAGHHGADCLLLEQRREPKPYSRANSLWARPQELLASVGIRDAIAEKSYRIRQFNTLLNGRTVDPIEIADVPSPYGPVLYSGQHVIETTLAEQVLAKGGRIERGRKVTGFAQDANGVTVTLACVSEDEEDTIVRPTETLRCRYWSAPTGPRASCAENSASTSKRRSCPNA
jgi:flavin-dependent dehydrogenase